MKDPVRELVEDLSNHGQPSLAWVLRFGAGGGDPVARAWTLSRSPQDMLTLLRASAHPALEAAQRVFAAPVLFESSDLDVVRSDAIRRVVTSPPKFAEVLGTKV